MVSKCIFLGFLVKIIFDSALIPLSKIYSYFWPCKFKLFKVFLYFCVQMYFKLILLNTTLNIIFRRKLIILTQFSHVQNNKK